MTSPPDDRELQALWQSQPPGKDVGSAIALNLIRELAQGFEYRIARRNRREYAGAAIAVVLFGLSVFTKSSVLLRIGSGMSIVAVIAVAYMIHRRGSVRTLPSDLALTSAIEFHRVQLERQRDLLRSMWWWYLLPLTPGVLVLEIGQALAQPEHTWRIIFWSVVMFLLMVGVYALNWRAAARVQRQIDRLKENL
jgi:hypothetical protein